MKHTTSRQRKAFLRALTLGAGLLATGVVPATSAAYTAHVWLNQGPPAYAGYRVRVHASWTHTSATVAWVTNGRPVGLNCWHDGGWTNLNYPTNRWFQVVVPNNTEPITGWLTASAIRKNEQPRLPACVKNVYTLGDGSHYTEWGPPLTAPSSPTSPSSPSPAPAPTPEASIPLPSPPPESVYPETTGGVSHTWTNYTNAGGYEGPPIPSNATVLIACAITGFRVADGNTWWYRIAQAPWSNTYYVSADAFYNNGSTSGSLRGTPFVDPVVRGC